jgi:hypothetical protein
MLAHYQAAFEKARERILGFSGAGWLCKTGLWPAPETPKCLVLNLLKPHWTSDSPDVISNTCGIFFSAWIDVDVGSSRPNRRLRYNIHALKLRGMPGYKLESRKFAEEFRSGFDAVRLPWPNLTLDHGPQTLMEGFVEVAAPSCEAELVGLAMRFDPVAPLIDQLLAKAKK